MSDVSESCNIESSEPDERRVKQARYLISGLFGVALVASQVAMLFPEYLTPALGVELAAMLVVVLIFEMDQRQVFSP